MIFDILTIFPDLLDSPLNEGILRRARQQGLIRIEITNIRDFAFDVHTMTDDRPFGGGEGMVMKPEPLAAALKSVRQRQTSGRVILLSPQGRLYNQRVARELAAESHLVLVCGRYEGVDERFRATYVDDEISIGDYILTGGELAAMVLVDSVSRLLPGVLGCSASAENDTFSRSLLKHPQFTRPRVFEGQEVPVELLSGDHAEIARFRFIASVQRTIDRRPELIRREHFSPEEKKILKRAGLDKSIEKLQEEGMMAGDTKQMAVDIALIHYPVINKSGETIGSAVTNLDIHDIARSARTFGVDQYYIVTPYADQQELVEEIIEHWQTGHGAQYNPARKSALALVSLVDSLEGVIEKVGDKRGKRPLLVTTSARLQENSITFTDAKQYIAAGEPVLLLFGTAHGLAPEVINKADYTLPPIGGQTGYNHLSVRSAVSIVLDRLLGVQED